MIIKDTRYIIKRIIIGVGICLVLGFINSCNVKAYELNSDELIVEGMGSGNTYCRIYYSVDDNKIYYYGKTSDNASWNQLLNLTYEPSHNYLFIGMDRKQSYNNHVYCWIYDFNSDIYLDNVNIDNINRYSIMYENEGTYTYFVGNSNMSNITTNVRNYQGIINGKKVVISNGGNTIYSNGSYSENKTTVINRPIFDKSINDYVFQNKVNSIFPLSLNSKILSLGVHKNLNEEENVITSYSFSPTFTNFNISNFTYQYKIGSNNWLNITTNDVSFNVNQNTTVYFRILNNSNEQIVDSQSFTITNILKYDDNVNQTYNVKYSSENKSVNDNESKIKHTVDNVSVFFEYFPKQSNLKYQYQFVNEGESLSTWVDMPSQDYERTFTTTENGTLYNRILDNDNNILYSSTFSVNSIGTLIIDDNASWYGTLFDKIGYGKGISEIFFLPVKILEILRDSLIDGICLDYSFGELWGHELNMPCINIRSLVGNNIYNFIDIVGVGVVSLAIINFIVDIYNGIVFMDLQDGEKRRKWKEDRLL